MADTKPEAEALRQRMLTCGVDCDCTANCELEQPPFRTDVRPNVDDAIYRLVRAVDARYAGVPIESSRDPRIVEEQAAISALRAALSKHSVAPDDEAVLDAYVETLPGFERASMGDDTHTDPYFDASDAVVAHNKARTAVLSRMAGKVPTWRKIADDTPEATWVLACQYTFNPQHPDAIPIPNVMRRIGKVWHWETGNPASTVPTHWMPLPAAPEAPR